MVPAFLLLIFIFFKLISDLFCSISGTSLKQNALQKEARFANRTQQIMFILFDSKQDIRKCWSCQNRHFPFYTYTSRVFGDKKFTLINAVNNFLTRTEIFFRERFREVAFNEKQLSINENFLVELSNNEIHKVLQ